MGKRRLVAALVFILASLAVLVTAGYVQFDESVLAEAHHTAHIALPTLAFMVFALHVAWDVRRHGWPTFSWRLN
jgi:hypothetical protein